MDPTTGKVNEEKLNQNFRLAIDAYIHRVDNCPCGETSIHLYKGLPSGDYQLKCTKLLVFLKSRKSREELKVEDLELCNFFKSVWAVCNSHMVTGLPRYIHFYALLLLYNVAVNTHVVLKESSLV